MLEIRRATLADSDAILACLAAAFSPYQSAYTVEAFRDTVLSRETIERRFATATLFVASSAQQIVGTIGCYKESAQIGHIRGMAVLCDWQGRGVAAALLERAEEELRAGGCARVTLDTTTPLSRAIRFYENHGYRPTGRVAEFFGMPLHEYAKQL